MVTAMSSAPSTPSDVRSADQLPDETGDEEDLPDEQARAEHLADQHHSERYPGRAQVREDTGVQRLHRPVAPAVVSAASSAEDGMCSVLMRLRNTQ